MFGVALVSLVLADCISAKCRRKLFSNDPSIWVIQEDLKHRSR